MSTTGSRQSPVILTPGDPKTFFWSLTATTNMDMNTHRQIDTHTHTEREMLQLPFSAAVVGSKDLSEKTATLDLHSPSNSPVFSCSLAGAKEPSSHTKGEIMTSR